MQSLVPIAVQKVSYFTAIARMMNSVLKVSGIPFVFLLQPELVLSHKPLTRAEQELARYDREIGGPLYVDCIERVHAEMARSMKTAADEDGYTFVNLLDAFDETSDQVFTDFAHLTPRGNKIIAERLYEMVRAALSE
jgi:hypothetical protein